MTHRPQTDTGSSSSLIVIIFGTFTRTSNLGSTRWKTESLVWEEWMRAVHYTATQAQNQDHLHMNFSTVFTIELYPFHRFSQPSPLFGQRQLRKSVLLTLPYLQHRLMWRQTAEQIPPLCPFRRTHWSCVLCSQCIICTWDLEQHIHHLCILSHWNVPNN